MKLRILGRNKFDEIIKKRKTTKVFDFNENGKIVAKVNMKKIKNITKPSKKKEIKISRPSTSLLSSNTNLLPLSTNLLPLESQSYPNQPIDILILTENDWSNTAYRFHKSLKLLGLHVEIYKGNKHAYDYPEQAPILKCLQSSGKSSKKSKGRGIGIHVVDSTLVDLIERSKIVNFHASSFYTIPNYESIYKNKRMVATHGGQHYRQFAEAKNNIFNKYCQRTIIQSPDLLNLGANNESLCYYPVDTDNIKPSFSFKDDQYLLIGHFPSNPAIKGSNVIYSAVMEVTNPNSNSNPDPKINKFKYIGVRHPFAKKLNEPWLNQLQKYQECDIYIETCKLELNGMIYGEWGNTCIEAAASGCIVITNSLSTSIYQKEYGDSPLLVANSREEILGHLKDLQRLSRSDLQKLKMDFRKWAEDKHSFLATGKRLWTQVYKKQMNLDEFAIEKIKNHFQNPNPNPNPNANPNPNPDSPNPNESISKIFENLDILEYFEKHKSTQIMTNNIG